MITGHELTDIFSELPVATAQRLLHARYEPLRLRRWVVESLEQLAGHIAHMKARETVLLDLEAYSDIELTQAWGSMRQMRKVWGDQMPALIGFCDLVCDALGSEMAFRLAAKTSHVTY